MDTYLVTGGAGFIGSNFIKYLLNGLKYEIKIICLDKLTYAGNLKNLEDELENYPDKFEFIKGDINNEALVNYIFENWEIDRVVNFAAESHVDRSIEDSSLFLATNVKGTQNLMDVADKHWMKDKRTYSEDKKFIQISTDEVYGSLGDEGYFTEETPLSPNSPYAASKASADMVVRSYFQTYKFPAIITRCSNNYGPYQFPEKLIPLMFNNIINGEELPVYGDGTNVRDWIHVKDHCRAIYKVSEKGEIGDVYNIGGDHEMRNIDIVKLLVDKVNDKVNDHDQYKNLLNTQVANIDYDLITFVEDRLGHDYRYAIKPDKIQELGWQPNISFEEGIERTIDWYFNNQEWLESVTSGEYEEYYEQMYLN